MNESLQEAVDKILDLGLSSATGKRSAIRLEDESVHEFAKYEFLLEPDDLEGFETDQLSAGGVAFSEGFEANGASVEAVEYIIDLLMRLEACVRYALLEGTPTKPNNSSNVHLGQAFDLIQSPVTYVLGLLYNSHSDLIARIARVDVVFPRLFRILYKWIRSHAVKIEKAANSHSAVVAPNKGGFSGGPGFDWREFVEYVEGRRAVAAKLKQLSSFGSGSYGALPNEIENTFAVYPERSVNVGIALLYRQRWKTLGIQPGEVVKTIPLGPGQSEKIKTKIVRRRKTVRNMESASETETSSESTDTVKDSSEIVNEAASKFEGSLEAKASYGVGGVGFGGSAKATASYSKEKSSKNTASSLSETMKKTASKVRRQTKVTVTTETEDTFEGEMTSEVHNKNDEKALTLQYSTLQTQYDVYSYLWSVRNAIFVAEDVPAPYEIDADWVRRYDWILAQTLLDESYRTTLNEIIQDVELDELVEFGNAQNPYRRAMNEANNSFASFDSDIGSLGGGLSIPDIYSKPLDQFEALRASEAERRRQNRIRDLRHARLFHHISQNMLHYCRAIWSREDDEQRLLRYRKEGRTVPLTWAGSLPSDAADGLDIAPVGLGVHLDEVVADIEPIGMTGNYLVFELADGIELGDTTVQNGEAVFSLEQVLDILRGPYRGPDDKLRDPAWDEFLGVAESAITDDGDALRKISDQDTHDYLSFFPERTDEFTDQDGNILRDQDSLLTGIITVEQWADYLLRKNGTRRFLVDSNNLYVNLVLGDGVALEPFKQAHRYIDVLTAAEEHRAHELKNQRRDLLKDEPSAFDPDISKVVVVPGGAQGSDIAGGLLEDDPPVVDDE